MNAGTSADGTLFLFLSAPEAAAAVRSAAASFLGMPWANGWTGPEVEL